jgi:hypothetical protein
MKLIRPCFAVSLAILCLCGCQSNNTDTTDELISSGTTERKISSKEFLQRLEVFADADLKNLEKIDTAHGIYRAVCTRGATREAEPLEEVLTATMEFTYKKPGYYVFRALDMSNSTDYNFQKGDLVLLTPEWTLVYRPNTEEVLVFSLDSRKATSKITSQQRQGPSFKVFNMAQAFCFEKPFFFINLCKENNAKIFCELDEYEEGVQLLTANIGVSEGTQGLALRFVIDFDQANKVPWNCAMQQQGAQDDHLITIYDCRLDWSETAKDDIKYIDSMIYTLNDPEGTVWGNHSFKWEIAVQNISFNQAADQSMFNIENWDIPDTALVKDTVQKKEVKWSEYKASIADILKISQRSQEAAKRAGIRD